MESKKLDFQEYTTSKGEKIKVHAVPQQIIRGITPKDKKPQRPQIDMTLPKGQIQKRFLKEGDPGWEDYQESLDAWEQKRNDLQEAVTYCFALKSYKFPEKLEFSQDIQDLSNLGLLEIPTDPYLKKFMWIRENVLGQHDEYNIRMIISELSGVPEEVVDEMKSQFRNFLLGKTPNAVGEGTSSNPGTKEEVSE
jgi:hypothetical protein